MNMCKKIINDIYNCLKFSTIISFVIIVAVGIVTMITSKANFQQVVLSIRGALLIIGGLVLLLGSILILSKKSKRKLENIEKWKEKYKFLSYKGVIIINGLIIITYGGIIDWLMIKLML